MNSNLERNPALQIFILCTPRSGSSLLRYILDTHSMICCPGELSLGQLCENLYLAIYYTTAQVRASDEQERSDLAAATAWRIVQDLMSSYARLKNKRIWCEKTPKNLQSLEMLNRVFPEAVYICLYRNCMDVAHSSVEGARHGKLGELKDYKSVVASWIDQTKEMIKFEQENPSKCFGVEYESLVLNPVETLNSLFNFIGVEWDESLLDQVFKMPHDEGIGDIKVAFSNKIYKSSIGKGSTIKRNSLSEVLIERMNAVLRDLGYPEVGPDWDHTPSPYLGKEAQAEDRSCLSRMEEVFTAYMPRQIRKHAELFKDLRGTLKFLVTGDDGGVWKIDLAQCPPQFVAEDGRTDCTITVMSTDLIKIVNGELNAGECFLEARLKVEGNRLLAHRFGRVVFGS